MASISNDHGSGRRRIVFTAADGRRLPIRLGRCTAKQAESARLFIEDLIARRSTGGSLKNATLEWLADLPDVLRGRLERAGLIEPRARRDVPTLGAWLSSYVAGRTDVKPNTTRNMQQAAKALIARYGEGRRLDDITPGDADGLRIGMKEQGLSEGTIRRACKRARQFFSAAVRSKIIADNPFASVKCGQYSNPERFAFVSRDVAQAVLDACPDAEWRLIFALCRYGGLRCPTEVLRLTWGDVDWERERFTVHASKTEHEEGGGVRVVPIFPELRPHLQEAFDRAEPGAVNVIGGNRGSNTNLRTRLTKIIRRAGLEPWPKLFQNLRSTRETELCETFPVHVVCKWLGNSQPVAARHYLQVTEDHFQKAARFPARRVAELGQTEAQQKSPDLTKTVENGAFLNSALPCASTEALGATPKGGRTE